MRFADEQEPNEEIERNKPRKNKSLARKIAATVLTYYGYDGYYDEEQRDNEEKALARVIKRVIRKHDAGK